MRAYRRGAEGLFFTIGWNWTPRLGSPHTIQRRTPGQRLEAAKAKSPNLRELGAKMGDRPAFAHGGECRRMTETVKPYCRPAAMAWSTFAGHWYAGSAGLRGFAGCAGATASHGTASCRSSTPSALYTGPAGAPFGSVTGPQIDFVTAAEAEPARTSVSVTVGAISERRRAGEGNAGSRVGLRAGTAADHRGAVGRPARCYGRSPCRRRR